MDDANDHQGFLLDAISNQLRIDGPKPVARIRNIISTVPTTGMSGEQFHRGVKLFLDAIGGSRAVSRDELPDAIDVAIGQTRDATLHAAPVS